MVARRPFVGYFQQPRAASLNARDLICERTSEGRTRAMANGVKFGRKRKLSDYQRAEAIKRRETLAAIAKSYGVAPLNHGHHCQPKLEVFHERRTMALLRY